MPGGDFTKHRNGPDAADFFATEAAGLAWLDLPGGPPIPRVLAVGASSLTMQRIETGPPTTEAAERFGRELARLHGSGADAFGSAPPGVPRQQGWIGDAPMAYSARDTFAPFWAEDRVLATARLAHRRGRLSGPDLGAVERFAEALVDGRVDVGPPERPSRSHGDLWSGNVLWGAEGRVWLIDPAAHGGHRESDLAMLALFGAPHLDRILAAYHESAPLAGGWRLRVPLHQTWPLLVHAALFGGGYGHHAMSTIATAQRA